MRSTQTKNLFIRVHLIRPFQTLQPFQNFEKIHLIHAIPTIPNIPECSKSLPNILLLIAECLEGKPSQLIWFTLPNLLRSYNLSNFQIISAILPAVVVIFPKLLLLLRQLRNQNKDSRNYATIIDLALIFAVSLLCSC